MIDQLYIDEARRIRKEYLTNLFYIVEKEDEMKSYMNTIENIKEELNEDESKINDNLYTDKVNELNKNIEKVKVYITKYMNKIQQLDKAQKRLYNNIKEKHIGITDEEMQKEIMNKIIDIDEKFKKVKKNTLDKFDLD